VSEDPTAAERDLRADDSGWSDRDLGPDRLVVEAYLRSAHGFLVDATDGREIGVVDDVIEDPATGRVVRLDVRGGWFGRRRTVIDVRDVQQVSPASRRIVVATSAVPELS
jgi:sporulation protein YlmC with PRC-barrel domain